MDNIIYAGSHGQEIIHPDGTKFVYPMPPEFTSKAAKLLEDLKQVCRDGAWVENKGVYLTFHYRNTPEELRADMVAKVKKLIEEADFKVGHAHFAIESKPKIDWNKGRASIHIVQTLFGLDWSEKVRVIYVGDDSTDEDAMEVQVI
jgi:trehalose 6-phosphate synthase/phosphatase